MEPPFDLVWLRSFLAVSAHLSFTRGAEEVGLSQPAVSGHVRSLERRCGRELLHRDTRTVRLTDDGEAMVTFARQILGAHDEAVRYFAGSAVSGRLRFGAADELALTELPGILRGFRQLHPQITLELTVTQSGTLLRRLERNHLDLVLVNQRAGAGVGRVVRSERLVWTGLPDQVLRPDEPVPFVTYRAPSWSRTVALEALAEIGRSWRITCHTREINGITAAVRAGLGACVLARGRIPPDLRPLDGQGLPDLPDVEMVLVANPRSAPEPVEALTRSVLGLPGTSLQESS